MFAQLSQIQHLRGNTKHKDQDVNCICGVRMTQMLHTDSMAIARGQQVLWWGKSLSQVFPTFNDTPWDIWNMF